MFWSYVMKFLSLTFNFFFLRKKIKAERNILIHKKYLYCLLNDKKYAKKIGPRTWCTKKSFGYRVVRQNSLMSYPGQNSNFDLV